MRLGSRDEATRPIHRINRAHPLFCEVSHFPGVPNSQWFFKFTFGVNHERRIEANQKLLSITNHPKVVAIGEIGLDYYYLKRSSQFSKYPSREKQILCFEQMLDLSVELRLPVIIHSREADSDVYAILKSYQKDIRGVVHCFSSDWDFAKKILDLNMACLLYTSPSPRDS